MFNNIYKNKKVLITGHTGFKGSWLALWLSKLGADVVGLSLETPVSIPNHFDMLKLKMTSEQCDIRDRKKLEAIFNKHQPEIVFHLAAQALVLPSYQNPHENFETNILGTLNVLETCRLSSSVRAIVNVTSDKVYENVEWIWGYREHDKLGGKDPYSASKAAVEIMSRSYRDSFFKKLDKPIYMASCRAGNVIGGGDWATNRLIPDLVRSASEKNPIEIRSPRSIRPWQHVLEPLSGYLLIGQELLNKKDQSDDSWNFGPANNEFLTVQEVIDLAKKNWSDISYKLNPTEVFQEAKSLKLDCTKAQALLGWSPLWNTQEAITMTVEWYKDFYINNLINSEKHLIAYIEQAKNGKSVWIN